MTYLAETDPDLGLFIVVSRQPSFVSGMLLINLFCLFRSTDILRPTFCFLPQTNHWLLLCE